MTETSAAENLSETAAADADEPTRERAVSPAEATDTRFLDASTMRFSGSAARLRLTIDGECSWRDVTALRIFPISDPDRYLSLRAGKEEIGILRDPTELDDANRELLDAALERRYLMPRIVAVTAVKERFGVIEWTVETDRGTKHFTSNPPRDAISHPTPERAVVTDVDGARYDIPDMNALDLRSKRILAAYV